MCISEKVVFTLAIIVLIILGLSACKTAEIIRYEHNPSVEFYKALNFESSILNEFKDDDILFVIDINKMTHTSYAVWLGLYSNQAGKSIEINRVVIDGGGWEKTQDLNRELTLDTRMPEQNLFRFNSGLKLFEVSEGEIGSIVNADRDLSLTVFYDLGNGTKSLTFVVKKTVEKQTVFST